MNGLNCTFEIPYIFSWHQTWFYFTYFIKAY